MTIIHFTVYDLDDAYRLLQWAESDKLINDHTARYMKERIEEYERKLTKRRVNWGSLSPRERKLIRFIKKERFYIVVLYNEVAGIKNPFLYRRFSGKENRNTKVRITEKDMEKFEKMDLIYVSERNTPYDYEERDSHVVQYNVYSLSNEADEMLELVDKEKLK